MTVKELLKQCQQNRTAVLATNFYNFETLTAVMQAAQKMQGCVPLHPNCPDGEPVRLVECADWNPKITTRADFALAESCLRAQEGTTREKTPRVGTGFDVHRLVPGRHLVLCGVEIPYELGLEGHSDADVAVHALMDAILGAAALGDIGRLFPDTDERYRGADSMKLLQEVLRRACAAGLRVVHADVTIIAQKPKLLPYMAQMAESLRSALPGAAVNVKATTTEGLGFAGRGEGIAAQAAATLLPW